MKTKNFSLLKLTFTLTFTLICVSAKAIPNFGCFTDGHKIFDIRGRFESRLSLYTFAEAPGEKGQYFALTNVAPDYFTVDALESDVLELPPFMEAGDTVYAPAHGQYGFFFINSDGKLHASLRHCEHYNDAEQIRRCDSLLVILGEYTSADDNFLALRYTDAFEPILVVDDGAPEPITFCKDVNFSGRGLIHIQTSRRRWLIDVTKEGLSVYHAAWDQARRHYQRGQLIRHYRYQGATRAALFSQSPVYFPFIDLINRFYSKAVLRSIISEMQENPGSYGSFYIPLLQRLEEQKVR